MKTILLLLILIGYAHPVFSMHKKTNHRLPQVYEEPELHASIRKKNVDLFEKLLSQSQGKDLSVRNSRDQTPLTLALIVEEPDMIRSLLEKGAQLDLDNPTDQGALKYAGRPIRKILRKYRQIKSRCQRIFRM